MSDEFFDEVEFPAEFPSELVDFLRQIGGVVNVVNLDDMTDEAEGVCPDCGVEHRESTSVTGIPFDTESLVANLIQARDFISDVEMVGGVTDAAVLMGVAAYGWEEALSQAVSIGMLAAEDALALVELAAKFDGAILREWQTIAGEVGWDA